MIGPSARDRRAPSPLRAYGNLERAFAACGLIAACGTTGGAVFVSHGYGWGPLLAATSMALLLCACLGIWAQDRVIQYQRGEVARVYASALDSPRRAVFDRRRRDISRMEALGAALVDLVDSLRMKLLGGDQARLWAISMRRALDDRAEVSRTLAAALGEDAHAIAAAAAAARRAETEIGADIADLFTGAGRAAEATGGLADEAEGLAATVRHTTGQLRQAASLAASLADSATAARVGVAGLGDVTGGLLEAANQVQAVLQRAERIAVNAGGGGGDVAIELRILAGTGQQAMAAMAVAIEGLKAHAAAMTRTVTTICESAQAQDALGQALSESMSHQMQAVARVTAKSGVAKGEIISLQQRASAMEQRELGLGTGPAARRAMERLPDHAEAIAKILRDLPVLHGQPVANS
jgi:hypothetical protein